MAPYNLDAPAPKVLRELNGAVLVALTGDNTAVAFNTLKSSVVYWLTSYILYRLLIYWLIALLKK